MGRFIPETMAGRAYTMALILTRVGVMLYVCGALARVVVEGEIQEALGKRKVRRHVQKIKDHYIICGFGRLGSIIARQLSRARIPIVVVENNPELIPVLEAQGYPFVAGDATREEVLLEAGIERAKGCGGGVALRRRQRLCHSDRPQPQPQALHRRPG